MPNKILRFPAVVERTSICRATIYNLIAAGIFPRPFRVGARAVGWMESDIDAWIESRAAKSHSEDAAA